MATTVNQRITRSGPTTDQGRLLLAADTKLPGGTMAFLADGYGTNVTNDGANKFAGVTTQEADNTGGSPGAVSVDVYRGGRIKLPFDAIEQADEGENVYASDNFNCTLTESENSFVGVLAEFVSATSGFVDIVVGRRGPQGPAGE